MKTEVLLDGLLTNIAREAIGAVADAETGNFGKLVAASRLDPQRHFRHTDLRDVDFSDTDLDRFDFTGADLRGAHGVRVRWSPMTTKLVDADLHGSLFAHRMVVRALLDTDETKAVAKRVRGLGWADQVLWAMSSIRAGNPEIERDRAIGWTVFDGTGDGFVKSEVLSLIERTSSPDDERTYDMLLDFINVGADDIGLMTKTIGVLRRSRHRRHPKVLAAVKSLLGSRDERVVAHAVEFLVLASPTRDEIRDVAQTALARRASQVRLAFISSLARRLGPAFEMVARNQITQDFRDVHERMTARELELLVRNIKRRISDERAAAEQGRAVERPILAIFDYALKTRAIEAKIESMLKAMAELGVAAPIVPWPPENYSPHGRTE